MTAHKKLKNENGGRWELKVKMEVIPLSKNFKVKAMKKVWFQIDYISPLFCAKYFLPEFLAKYLFV